MTNHPSIESGLSQCDIALETLRAADGEWVSLTTLHTRTGSLAVHSRINDLRQRGHRIEQRSERVKKRCHSFYLLIAHA